VTANSETGHSGVAEWRDRFTFDSGPWRRDSRIVVREGLLSRDATGSIRPKAEVLDLTLIELDYRPSALYQKISFSLHETNEPCTR
jgi:hypothetical protein